MSFSTSCPSHGGHVPHVAGVVLPCVWLREWTEETIEEVVTIEKHLRIPAHPCESPQHFPTRHSQGLELT